MKTFKFLSLLTIAALLVSSCGNKQGKTSEESSEAMDIKQYIEAAKAITPNLEDISQYIKALEVVDAKYYPVLVNDPYKAHDYKSTFPAAAANLGIYSIDIIYHAYGEAIESAYLTFAAAQELAKFIGIEGAFAAITFDAFEGSISNRDSIAMIINELLKESQNYASDEEVLFIHAAYLAGAYAEKMHIISSLIQQSLKSESLTPEDEINLKESIVIYVNRLKSVDALLKLVEPQAEQIKSVALLENFQQLRKLATSLEAEEEAILSSTIDELKENALLNASFETVSKIRTLIVTAG